MSIAIAGNAILDLYKHIDRYPAASSLTSIRSVSHSPGGLLCNCAMDLARLDPDLRIPVVGILGNDAEKTVILEALMRYSNIDTQQIHFEGSTSFTDVMEDSENGTRTFFQYRGANALLDIEHFNFDKLDADLLHVGYALLLDTLDQPDSDYGTRLARLLKLAQSKGIRTSIDAVSEDSDRFATVIPPALKYTDYCIVNEIEALGIVNKTINDSDQVSIPVIQDAAKRILEMGVKEWVIIHWRDGAAGFGKQGEWVTRPATDLAPEMIATRTGAGDAFASGVLYGAYQNMPLSGALELGLGTATGSLMAPSASDGVGQASEMLKLYHSSDKNMAVPAHG